MIEPTPAQQIIPENSAHRPGSVGHATKTQKLKPRGIRLKPDQEKGTAIEFKPPNTHKNSKQANVIDMMRQPGGATLAQITTATNWKPHSVRGFISGVVRKKLGLEVLTEKDHEGNRIYRISPTNPMGQ